MEKPLERRDRPKAIDLFCGAGGMSLGFEQAGFDIVLGVDVDGHHVAVHKRNFPKHPTLCTSIVGLTASGVFEAIGGRVEIDLVCGGPPCQGFSNMGLRDSQDPRNSLVDHFARLVAEIRPKVFVMENVPGMASGKTQPILDRVIAFLTEAGYKITKPVQVLDASAFGVPQRRKRLFLLGARSDLGITLVYPLGPRPGQPVRPTVWETIGDLPDLDGRQELFRIDESPYDKEPVSAYAKVARGLAFDPTDFSYPREWPRHSCTGCLRIRHVASAVELYRATPPGKIVPGHKLPRLDPNGICSTLRAGSDSTHGSYTAPRPIHPMQPRCITAREAARLHGFPDWFAFFPTKWHAYRQIGNAVCPPVARAIGLAISEALRVAPSKPREPVCLAGDFGLPKDRPKMLKRIPYIKNYPPVIARLFATAYDADKRCLRQSRFTFQNVQDAIRLTGVTLPWTRPDTFVQELARSRRVRQLLASCLEKGYSIRPVNDGDFIGEFVLEGELGSITDKDIIEIRSRDLRGAVPLSNRIAPDQLIGLVEDPAVVRGLWHDHLKIEEAGQLGLGNGEQAAKYRLTNQTGPPCYFCVVVVDDGHLPTKGRIKRLGELAETPEVVLLARVTSKHVAAIRFQACQQTLCEVRRCIFQVEISDRVENTLFGTVVLPALPRRRRRPSR